MDMARSMKSAMTVEDDAAADAMVCGWGGQAPAPTFRSELSGTPWAQESEPAILVVPITAGKGLLSVQEDGKATCG
jgi:hypothetical protein